MSVEMDAVQEIVWFEPQLALPMARIRNRRATEARLIIAVRCLGRLLAIAKELPLNDERHFEEQLLTSLPALCFDEAMLGFLSAALELDGRFAEAGLDDLIDPAIVDRRRRRILEAVRDGNR